MSSSEGVDLCTHYVKGHGVCLRKREHPIHDPEVPSPNIHRFERSVYAEQERMALTLENIPFISERSGRSMEDLELMLLAAEKKGRSILVSYDKPRKDES